MFKYIINRLTERSTWLGLIALATACGAIIETSLAEYIVSAGVALAGLVGIVTRDKTETSQDGKEDSDNG